MPIKGELPLRRRQLTLFDTMVFVAAIAECLVIPHQFRSWLPDELFQLYDRRQYGLILAAAWLSVLSLALALVAIFGPASRPRRRFYNAGTLAAVMVMLTLTYATVQVTGHGLVLLASVGHAFEMRAWWVFGPIYNTAQFAGLAVLAGWVTLALTRTWRTSPDWLDRFGRLLGVI